MEDFREPLFSCEKTPGLFCFLLGFTCVGGPCCVQGKVVSEVSGESFAKHCALPCLCLCFGSAYNRQILRKNLGLESAYSSDLLLHACCNPCAVNQEFLEFHGQSFKGKLNLLSILKDRPNKRSFTPLAPVDNTVN